MDLKSFLHPPSPESKKELSISEYRYVTFAHWAGICGVISHFLLIFVFFHIGLTIMAYVNFLSVGIFLLSIYSVHKRRNLFLFCILVTIEVNIHAGLAVYFLGWASGFQYFIFVAVLSAFFIQYKKLSIAIAIFSIINFIILFILFATRIPPFYTSVTIINLFNIAIGITSLIIVGSMAYMFSRAVDETENRLQVQYDRAERLLRNILPESVAERLKEKEQLIADGFAQSSILFADLQNFTEFSGSTTPKNLVYMLNELFSSFDDLLEQHGVEKIKTIGDAYMVASGLPQESDRHAEQILDYARAMLAAINDFNNKQGLDFSIRIGVNSGPVIAGVVGKKKYSYDLWGDTVNVASRMEASGFPGEIHLSENTYRLIKNKYNVIKREPLQIKGKGLMQTYFLRFA
jgi:adenylate cyclase